MEGVVLVLVVLLILAALFLLKFLARNRTSTVPAEQLPNRFIHVSIRGLGAYHCAANGGYIAISGTALADDVFVSRVNN